MEHYLEDDLGRLILKLAKTIIKNRNHHLRNLELTTVQADSMQFFLAHEGASITDLKDYMEVTHQTACGIVQRIAARGWVELTRSQEDARRQVVIPTQSGRELGEAMTHNRMRTGGKLLENMSETEREVFFRLLTLSYENVKND